MTPEQRLHIAVNDALADAFRRGELEGRAKVLGLLTRIVKAPNKNQRLVEIKQAERELAKWGV